MTTALSIQNLSKTYKNGFEALKGIDLDVQEGDFFALLGPNGAGKSTTIGIISSLIRKSAGQVSIFGHDIDQDFSRAKQELGVVPQEFNFSIFDKAFDIVVTQAGYYGMSRKEATQRAERYFKELGIWDKRDEVSRNMSGGMKRRLMIARALVHQPRLLILDEPTAGVDIEMRRLMWGFLQELNERGTTIILTTHYLEEAESLCRNIAIINRGEIAENASMKDLLAQLHREVLILDVEQSLKDVPEVAGFDVVKTDSHSLEVEVSREQNLNDLFNALSAQGVSIRSMRNKANRLEELFVNLVSNESS